MFNRKLLLVGITTLGLSSVAFANGGGFINNTQSTSAQNGYWSIGVEGLYLKPTNGDLTYALVGNPVSFSSGATPINGKTVEIDPDYNFGFNLVGQYCFAGTGNNITASYTHFSSSESDSVSVPEVELNVEDIFDVRPLAVWSTTIHPDNFDERGDKAKAEVNFDYDAVDLLAGRFVDLGNNLTLNLSAGLRYANINVDSNALYQGNGDLGGIFIFGEDGTEVTLKSEYAGIGPRVSISGNYDFGNGFGANVNAGASLLTGDLKATHYQYDHDNVEPFDLEVDVEKKPDHVVPELDVDLGLTYTYQMANAYSFTVGAGWRTTNYIEARNRLQFHDENAGALANNLTNMSFNGPYLGLHLSAAV